MLNRPVKAALFAALCLSSLARAGELTLFTDVEFRGRPVTLVGSTPNLFDRGFNDRASSMIVQSGRWELCEHVNFGGRCVAVGPGEYRNMDQFSDRVSSVRELVDPGRGYPGQWEQGRHDQDRGEYGQRYDERRDQGGNIELFSDARFRGERLQLDRDSRDLNEFAFNDRAASIVVHSGTWTLCQDVRYRGQCITLEPGRYRHLRGMDYQISSIKRVR